MADLTYPDWLPLELWEDWKQIRASKGTKHVMTERAEKHALIQLAKYREQGYDPEAIVRRACVAKWDGLFVKPEDKAQTYRDREAKEREWEKKKKSGPKTREETATLWEQAAKDRFKEHFNDFMEIFQSPCKGGPKGQYERMLELDRKYPGKGWKEEAENFRKLVLLENAPW